MTIPNPLTSEAFLQWKRPDKYILDSTPLTLKEINEDVQRYGDYMYEQGEKAAQALAQQSQWRPIETAPIGGPDILVMQGQFVSSAYWESGFTERDQASSIKQSACKTHANVYGCLDRLIPPAAQSTAPLAPTTSPESP